jgi:hypothetical protein
MEDNISAHRSKRLGLSDFGIDKSVDPPQYKESDVDEIAELVKDLTEENVAEVQKKQTTSLSKDGVTFSNCTFNNCTF